jgi:hypothetical protein
MGEFLLELVGGILELALDLFSDAWINRDPKPEESKSE